MGAFDLPSLDIYEFRKTGGLVSGAAQVVLCIANIGELPISIDWEAVYYGGARPWWLCPECLKRRRFLRVRGGRAACVACFGLVYRRVYWSPLRSRALRRAAKLRARIGADVRPFSAFPSSPRQHRAAKWYARVVEEIRLCEREALGAFAPRRRKRR
jgi:hypothetical protein